MANVPENLHYSKDHEWVRVEGDMAVIGITDHAQEQLGDVVYVELPKEGEQFASHESFGSVESVKAVSEIFTPVSGKVAAVKRLSTSPGFFILILIIQPSPYGSLLTFSGSSANDSLTSVTAPETGVKISETAFTDSTEPNDSLAANSSPTLGNST